MKRERFHKGEAVPAPAQVDSGRRESPATRLIAIGRQSKLFCNSDTPYATVRIDDHFETMALHSRAFKSYLSGEFFQSVEGVRAANGEALNSAILVLEKFARAEVHTVFVRVAEDQGNIYVDLGDTTWQVIKITAKDWQLLPSSKCPVRFRRPRGMLALPIPVKGGTIEELRPFVNTLNDDAGEASFALLVAWLVMAFHPDGPYPVLVLQGEQGSAKTTTAKVLRALTDPHEAALRRDIRETRDLAICAQNAWVVGLDNLSHLSQWLSDTISCLSTGHAFGTRELYSDDEEKLFSGKRPVMLNGIEQFVETGDLVDRGIFAILPPIRDECRRTELEFWHEFEAARPRLLGAVLDAVSCALHYRNTVSLKGYPRMADFATWITAAEPALNWAAGTFLEVYGQNRREANDFPLQSRLIERLNVKLPFEGTVTELLRELETDVSERVLKGKDWPGSPQALANRLRRLAPNLRRAGVEVEFRRRHGGQRVVIVTRAEQAQ